MALSYRYSARTIHGAAKLESELDARSGDGWEPISFQHDAAGNFKVILRHANDGGSNGAVRQRETAAVSAESARYTVRTIRAPKFESELTGLSNEGWQALSFQHDSAGTYEVILRQNPNAAAGEVSAYKFTLRSVHGSTKLETTLVDLSDEGWEPVRIQRDGAGSYEVILRQLTSE